MFTKYLALVSESAQVPQKEVARISSALQKQITRDFTPLWNVPATIDFFQDLDDVPSDYWPIIIRDDIGFAGAAGIHLDRNGQPYALVQASDNVGITCSHECLEMLADPFGDRFVASQSLKAGQGRVNYLVEVCDPSEAEDCGYVINGILVSDFYTNNFFDPVGNPAVRYSYTGAIKHPRQVLPGGYISWMIPETGEWWQATYFGASLSFRSLGMLQKEAGKGWRELIDAATFQPVAQRLTERFISPINMASALAATTVKRASSGRTKRLQEDIELMIASAKSQETEASIAAIAAIAPENKKAAAGKLQLLRHASLEDKIESFDTTEASIPFLVKLAILQSGGIDGDPEKVGDDEDLSDYIKVHEQWVLLTAFMVRIIEHFNPAGTISFDEVQGCTTVGVLIKAVTEKINQ